MSGSRSVARLDTIYSAIKAANEKYEHENSENTAALVYTELPSLGLARWVIEIFSFVISGSLNEPVVAHTPQQWITKVIISF